MCLNKPNFREMISNRDYLKRLLQMCRHVQTMVHSFWFRKQLALFLCCPAFRFSFLLLPSNEAYTHSVGLSSPVQGSFCWKHGPMRGHKAQSIPLI